MRTSYKSILIVSALIPFLFSCTSYDELIEDNRGFSKNFSHLNTELDFWNPTINIYGEPIVVYSNSEETMARLAEVEEEVDIKVKELIYVTLKESKVSWCGMGVQVLTWKLKKQVLKKDYNIEWFSPMETDPQIAYMGY